MTGHPVPPAGFDAEPELITESQIVACVRPAVTHIYRVVTSPDGSLITRVRAENAELITDLDGEDVRPVLILYDDGHPRWITAVFPAGTWFGCWAEDAEMASQPAQPDWPSPISPDPIDGKTGFGG